VLRRNASRILTGAAVAVVIVVVGWFAWGLYKEYQQVTGVATDLMDHLRVDDYAGAYAQLCPQHDAETVDGLREEFGRHAKPWEYDVGDVSYSQETGGYVNLTVDTADHHTQQYHVDVSFVDGVWRACSISRGSVQDY